MTEAPSAAVARPGRSLACGGGDPVSAEAAPGRRRPHRRAVLRGLVVGRFQRATSMTRQLLEQIIDGQPPLAGLPVLANVDIGHTSPMATLRPATAILQAAWTFSSPGSPPGGVTPAMSGTVRPYAQRRTGLDRLPGRPRRSDKLRSWWLSARYACSAALRHRPIPATGTLPVPLGTWWPAGASISSTGAAA